MILAQHSANHNISVANAMSNRTETPDSDAEKDKTKDLGPTLNTPLCARRSPKIAGNHHNILGYTAT